MTARNPITEALTAMANEDIVKAAATMVARHKGEWIWDSVTDGVAALVPFDTGRPVLVVYLPRGTYPGDFEVADGWPYDDPRVN